MSEKTAALLSSVLHILCLTAFLCLLGTDVLPDHFPHLIKYITVFLVFAFGYLGSVVRCMPCGHPDRCRRIMHKTFVLLFVVYLILLLDFTLIDDSFGRSVSNIFSRSREEIALYFANNTNLIPFATVRLFIRGYRNGAVSAAAMLENIAGNLLVFMPFAFFVPIVFSKRKSFPRFLISIALLVIIIELLQVLLLTGSSDVDDLILNVAGAAAAYGVLRIGKVGRALSRITFGVWQGEEV